MGFLGRKATRSDLEAALPITLANSDYRYGFQRVPWTGPIDGGRRGSSVDTALTIPAFWAGVRLIAEDMARLPLIIYRRVGEDRERAQDHPLYEPLHDFANPYMTAFNWRRTMMAHVLTWGNGCSERVYDRAGRLQLWPLPPSKVDIYWNARGQKEFAYHGNKGDTILSADEVFHVSGFGFDGIKGYSVVQVAHTLISGSLGTDAFTDTFYRNGARPSIIATTPIGMPEPTIDKFNKAWQESHQGADNWHKMAVLRDGITVAPFSMPLDDAQFIETKKFQTTDFARLLRIPPHKIGDLERATFSNIDEQSTDYVVGSLGPWCSNFEQEVRLQLMRDDREHYAEFLMDALLRGDPLKRAQKNEIEHRNGALLTDEWRRMENRNSLPDGLGSEPRFSSGLQPIDEPAEPEPAEPVDVVGELRNGFAAETKSLDTLTEATVALGAREDRISESIGSLTDAAVALAGTSRSLVGMGKSLSVRDARIAHALEAFTVAADEHADRPVVVTQPEPRPIFKRVVRDDAGRLLGVMEEPA